MNKFKPVIGLEVHIELSTQSKMFCGCSAFHFGVAPNTNVCPVCLGLPGALPFANSEAIDRTIKFGLAYECQIAEFSKFDRKNYFYPDLPKAYQISQYDLPLCTKGKFGNVRIRRIHLEEDTGKLIHKNTESHIDFNRSGVPLLELVTEPDFKTGEGVVNFLKEVRLMAQYLEISNADMEKGSMRLEANVSVATDENLPDYKVELKNINSFKFIHSAIEAEVKRQIEVLERGEIPSQETRGYNENTGKTFSQRGKEEAKDYRYFPEPDLPPLRISSAQVLALRSTLPELPEQKREKLKELNLPSNYIEVLISDLQRIKYFEEAVKLADKHKVSIKDIAGVMINQNLDKQYPEVAGLIKKLVEITKKEYATKDEVSKAVKEVLVEAQKAVEDYKSGKVNVLGFLIGTVQKKLKGRGNPKEIEEFLKQALNA